MEFDLAKAPAGAKRVKLPVSPSLSDLFLAYGQPAWDGEHETYREDVLLEKANELLFLLNGLKAYPLCSAERLVEEFFERV